jgi:exodeoxyribonuclease V alpha subunit
MKARLGLVSELLACGVLSPLDHQLAQSLGRIQPDADPRVLLGAALASRAVRRGHVCVDLETSTRAPLLDAAERPVVVELPELSAWRRTLAESAMVSARPDPNRPTPLVLDGRGRLYLYRYASYQERLAAALLERASEPVPWDPQALVPIVERLFAGVPRGEHDEQRFATLVAARHRLSVISGGPGTGKTTTVSRLLALLQEQALAERGRPLRLALVAPTGKAAQRLAEAIERSLRGLDVSEEVRRSLAVNATTIHRALGFRPATPTRFRHDAGHPLSVDVVLADESSMIDLALMTKLVEAVPRGARLVLIGDRDQLASVEAGAILGDVFDPERHCGYSEGLCRDVATITGAELVARRAAATQQGAGIDDCLVQLTKSYRYTEHSGIGALARAINAGDADRAMTVLQGEEGLPYGEVAIAELAAKSPLDGPLGTAVRDGFAAVFASDDPRERLEHLTAFRILCAHRRGSLGVEALNEAVEQHLRERGLVVGDSEHYDGRPVLITRNDHQLELFNGDVGVVSRDEGGGTRVWFADADGGVRGVHPGRLPPHETVYAMTVHKSQGSEFARVAIVLPARPSPVLTRELVYTAVSRARQRVDIHGSEAVLRGAIARRVERASGLADALLGGDEIAHADDAT